MSLGVRSMFKASEIRGALVFLIETIETGGWSTGRRLQPDDRLCSSNCHVNDNIHLIDLGRDYMIGTFVSTRNKMDVSRVGGPVLSR
jgi:hypothetical protein